MTPSPGDGEPRHRVARRGGSSGRGGGDPRASWGSYVVLALVTAPRLWAAFKDQGILSPQETFEALEHAHRLAFGWGFVMPELAAHARSWLFPGALALVWKVASVGLRTPELLVGLAKGSMAALSIASVWLAMSLARRYRSERAAILAGLLSMACAPLVAFGSRPFAETAAAPLVVGAALLLDRPSRRRAIDAGVLIGLAALLRYETLVLGAGLLAILVARRGTGEARLSAFGAAGVLGLAGLLDWPTLGWPFRSLLTELKESVLRAHPASYTKGDLLYYPDHLTASIGVSLAVVLLGLALAPPRARGVVAVLALYLAVHVLLPQRELRFLMPVLPLTLAVAAAGLTRAIDGLRYGAWATYVVGGACAAQMAWITQGATRSQLGYDTSETVIWHAGEDYLRATEAAGAIPGLCGVIYLACEPRWSGGYTYLHRSVPVFFDTHPDHLAAANAVVGGPGERLPAPWRRGAPVGRFSVWQRPDNCTPPPANWTMILP